MKNSKWHDLITILNENPELVKINSKLKRNEGALMDQNKKCGKEQKKLYQVAICFYLKDQKCFCLKNGLLIF